MGAYYRVGYIGDGRSKRDLLKEQMDKWEINISRVTKTAGIHPQKSYSMLVRAIQLKWIFLNV